MTLRPQHCGHNTSLYTYCPIVKQAFCTYTYIYLQQALNDATVTGNGHRKEHNLQLTLLQKILGRTISWGGPLRTTLSNSSCIGLHSSEEMPTEKRNSDSARARDLGTHSMHTAQVRSQFFFPAAISSDLWSAIQQVPQVPHQLTDAYCTVTLT